RALDRELLERRERDVRVDLEHRPVAEPVLAFRQRLDPRPAGRIQIVLLNRAGKARADHVAQNFVPDLAAEALQHHLAGDLAGPEALQPGRAAHFLEPRLDLALDHGRRHADGHPALEAGAGFHRHLEVIGGVHRYSVGSYLVRKGRLELPRVAPLDPKSSASTNSATFAAGLEAGIRAPLWPVGGSQRRVGPMLKPSWHAMNSTRSAASRTLSSSGLPWPCPTSRSTDSRIGFLRGSLAVAAWSAAAIFRACSGWTRLSFSPAV